MCTIAPSFGGGGGGGGGKRGRDGDDGRDRRRPGRAKPLDKIGAADFGPDGRIRQLILLLLQTANLGNLPRGGLLIDAGTQLVRRWVNGHIHASKGLMAARYTELAESFVHVLRAVANAGYFDQLVAMLLEFFTTQTFEQAKSNDEEE